MYLKSIELTGFKSFAKKGLLEFSSPVTSIVGPNGSGKSNIVEAIRFVLGEQSMKSLRGKSGTDLIFKGSKILSKLNRASVTIKFDNTKKIFALATLSNESIKVDYDEISITREVYPDGINKYLINGTEVRLKDVHELVSSVNIGASGHHIISQGEADRVLNASVRERKSIVEDALGLRTYHFRLKESEKKLEKTKLNIKEAQSLRREIAPHITFLKKQVDKLHKAEEMREELEVLSKQYLKNEEVFIKTQKDTYLANLHTLDSSIKSIDEQMKSYASNEKPVSPLETQIQNKEKEIREIRTLHEELSRKLGRIEAMIELEENRSVESIPHKDKVSFSKEEIDNLTRGMLALIEEAVSSETLVGILPILQKLKSHILEFSKKDENPVSVIVDENVKEDKLIELQSGQKEISREINSLLEKEENIYKEINRMKEEIRSNEEKFKLDNQMRFDLMMKKNEMVGEMNVLKMKISANEEKERMFLEEIKELSVLVGQSVLRYKDHVIKDDVVNITEQEERHKKIERLKIKLEDTGAIGGGEVIKEYQEVSERDAFLSREIDDLEKSIESIKTLIYDLKEKLNTEFKTGIEKINKQFQTFFSLMFGGGTAFLSVIVEQKRKYKKSSDEEDDMEEIEEEIAEGAFEEGIEINISLPQKKVKELTMLSGGERSLTSIALLFAISQVNPPPFLVLDETDAALDESNSRKYGDMIETLAKYSQLIVVTHNRETMSRANVLYGITLGADGASRLLSVKFEEAVAIAK
jgi:chromosome segregation protein